MYDHAVIIGGTGMLRFASIALAADAMRLSSIARTQQSLHALDAMLPETNRVHHCVQLDWSDPNAFLEGVARHISKTEPPDLVVAWIHDDSLVPRVASILAEFGETLQFFHITGSATQRSTSESATALQESPPHPNVSYRRIVLGSRRTGSRRRWLTHEEISTGVLHAILLNRPLYVVGSLE